MRHASRKSKARIDKDRPVLVLHSPINEQSYEKQMEDCMIKNDITIKDEERSQRATEIQRIVAEKNPVLVNQGIAAYKKALPELLADGKHHYVVAYHGDQQVAIEPTREVLRETLRQKGFTKRGEMFITRGSTDA